MKGYFRLGKVFGIELRLHYSWLIIAVLITLSLASYFAEAHPDWNRNVIWAMSVSTALLFFLSIVLHEFSHAVIAKKNGLPVRSITLFALGGLAHIEKEAETAKTEFWLGLIGPITSVLIGAVSLGVARLLGWEARGEPGTPTLSVLVWLGYVNIALAVFNMIPGFPMDGGRVLRAIIWKITGNPVKATRAASKAGQYIAISFIMLGVYMFFTGFGFGGLWIAFIGWFLLNSAKASYLQVEFTEGLRGVTVSDLMSRDCPVVDGNLNLESLVEEHLLKTGQRCFMVTEESKMAGLITPHEIKGFDRRMWPLTTASAAMRPIGELHTVTPEMPVMEAFEVIGREGVNQLPVVSEGELKGIITREQIINYLFTRRELNL